MSTLSNSSARETVLTEVFLTFLGEGNKFVRQCAKRQIGKFIATFLSGGAINDKLLQTYTKIPQTEASTVEVELLKS